MTPPSGRETSGHRRPPLTPAQRRAVIGAAAGTGEVRAGPATLAALAALGLARPHGRLGAHYLTATGHALRERLHGPDTTDETVDPAPSGFSPATGEGPPHPAAGRVEAVARAWESLLEIRRLVGNRPDRSVPGRPAPWERARPVHAVALALEASGTPSSARDGSGRRVRTGYRVTPDRTEPGGVRVEWRTAAGAARDGDGPDRLDDCARTLARCGWEAERYTDSRRRPFLLVVPRSDR